MIHLHNIYVCNDISNSSHQLVFQGKSLILSQMKATFTLYCDRRRHFWEGYHDGEAGNCPRGCRSPPTGPLLLSSLTSRSTYCLSIILCPPTGPLLQSSLTSKSTYCLFIILCPPTGPLLQSSLTSRSTYCLSIILYPPTGPLLQSALTSRSTYCLSIILCPSTDCPLHCVNPLT